MKLTLICLVVAFLVLQYVEHSEACLEVIEQVLGIKPHKESVRKGHQQPHKQPHKAPAPHKGGPGSARPSKRPEKPRPRPIIGHPRPPISPPKRPLPPRPRPLPPHTLPPLPECSYPPSPCPDNISPPCPEETTACPEKTIPCPEEPTPCGEDTTSCPTEIIPDCPENTPSPCPEETTETLCPEPIINPCPDHCDPSDTKEPCGYNPGGPIIPVPDPVIPQEDSGCGCTQECSPKEELREELHICLERIGLLIDETLFSQAAVKEEN